MATINKLPFECYSWLRHAAKCQVVQPGWKFASDSATQPLASLAEAWAGVQQFMENENFREPEGFAYMLGNDTLEEALQRVPDQMVGIRMAGGEYTAYSIGVMERNNSPFRNIRIYPADIRDTAVQMLSLLASGISARCEVYRCVPSSLTENQTTIINDLFSRLETVFRKAGFAVTLHAVTAEQVREAVGDYGAELPSRHIVKLERDCSSTSSSPTEQNPALMWVNVSCRKLEACIRRNQDYGFHCTSVYDGIEAVYSIPAQELHEYLACFCNLVNGEKWSFYLDFKNGAICSDIAGHCAHPLTVELKSSL